MTIKMTLRDAIAAFQAIEMLPIIPDGKTSYSIGYIGDKLEQHVRRFNKEREKIGREIAGPGVELVPPEKMEEFNARVDAILDMEITVEREPVTLDAVLGEKPEKRPELKPSILRALVGRIIIE